MVTIASERRLLSTHLTWIAGQPWVDDMYHELSALLAQLRATNGTAEPKPVARCHHCEGPIRVDTLNGYAFCAQCRATWTGPQLIDLAAIAEEARRPRTDDGRAMMTVAQIVEQFGGNAKAVRMRLARYGVTAVDGHFDPAIFEKVTV